MAIITFFNGPFARGEEVIADVVERLAYKVLENEVLRETSRRFAVPADKLERSMTGPLPLFNKLTRDRLKHTAYLKVMLAQMIQQDNIVLVGPVVHLLPRTISHILRVCVIANHDYRIRTAMEASGKSMREAQKLVHKLDSRNLEWTRYLFDKLPYDESLYDILIAMQDSTVAEAVDLVCETAGNEPLKTTDLSQQATDDFLLAARVNLKLVEAGHDVEVQSANGLVTLIINKYVVRLEKYKEEITETVSTVEGVRAVKTKIGPGYRQPAINTMRNIEMPSKILLVDDEEEFVHTLSERLQTRNFESSVVYDGEQALDFVNRDEPDVMVLDLKMPGIDGIEVLRRIKREHPAVEVIILTGHGSEREETLAAELGAFAYLHKPVNIDVLSQAMREAYQKVNIARDEIKGGEKDENN